MARTSLPASKPTSLCHFVLLSPPKTQEQDPPPPPHSSRATNHFSNIYTHYPSRRTHHQRPRVRQSPRPLPGARLQRSRHGARLRGRPAGGLHARGRVELAWADARDQGAVSGGAGGQCRGQGGGERGDELEGAGDRVCGLAVLARCGRFCVCLFSSILCEIGCGWWWWWWCMYVCWRERDDMRRDETRRDEADRME